MPFISQTQPVFNEFQQVTQENRKQSQLYGTGFIDSFKKENIISLAFNYFLNNKKLDSKKLNILELGTNHGHTTRILASLFKKVDTFDLGYNNLHKARLLNNDFSNINYYKLDVYIDDWPIVDFDTVFVDCLHQAACVFHDIIKILSIAKYRKIYIIFDDYGLSWGNNANHVRMSVKYFIEKGYLKSIKNKIYIFVIK